MFAKLIVELAVGVAATQNALGTGNFGSIETTTGMRMNPGLAGAAGMLRLIVSIAIDAPAAVPNSPFYGWMFSCNSKVPPIASVESRAKVISEIQATGVDVSYPN